MSNEYNIIINLVGGSKSWGIACNKIQDAAYQTFTDKQWNAFAAKQEKDMRSCEGKDCIVFNGRYFDWREFSPKKLEIIQAYLSYFSETELKQISQYLQRGGK